MIEELERNLVVTCTCLHMSHRNFLCCMCKTFVLIIKTCAMSARSTQLLNRASSMDSPEPTAGKRQPHSATITRSQTVYERRVSGTPSGPGSLPVRGGRQSPLKRFREAKESISKAFDLVRKELVKVQKFLGEAHGDAGSGKVSDLLDKTQGIEEILSRDHMKVELTM